MFKKTLINGHRVLSSNDPKTGPFPLSWAARYLGRPALKRVSVGEFDGDKWVEERVDYVWVSDLAPGFWLPAIAPNKMPQPYQTVKKVLGNDCYLSEEIDGIFWVSKADSGLKIPADITTAKEKTFFDASEARMIIGPCSLGYNSDGNLCWISQTAFNAWVLAETPDLKPKEKFFGA